MTEDNERRYKALFRDIARDLDLPPEPQDYLGLDAAGFLMVALGHLAKAREKLGQEPPSYAVHVARQNTVAATNFVRFALELLDEHAKGAVS